jgi:hypothetical protein
LTSVRPAILIPIIGCFLAAASIAVAGTTREAYIATVDPMCKQTDRKTRRALRDYRETLNQHRHQRAARILLRGLRIYARSVRRLKEIEPPPADAALIAKWLGLETDDIAVTRRMATALRRERFARYNRLVRKSIDLEHRIDRTLRGYGFRYCN